jgi:uncharacterized protein DUF2510
MVAMPDESATSNPPRWADDPTGRHELRYWDGTRWTDHVSDRGVQSTDAVASEPAAAVDAPAATAQPSEPTPSASPSPATNSDERAVSAAPPRAPTEQFVLTIGDIGVSPHWVVTPAGTAPLAGSAWIARDMSRTERKIPTWAIVLAIVFAIACLLGLLFLLAKEDRTTGYVEVTVTAPGLQWMTQVPVSTQAQIARVRQDVAYAQSLAASASK